MKELYVCDGMLPSCDKRWCGRLGKGECFHTSDEAHSLYEPPREWEYVMEGYRIEKKRSR